MHTKNTTEKASAKAEFARRELSYDGLGINGIDCYRSRIATFSNAQAATGYGPLFASAPDLLAALKIAMRALEDRNIDELMSGEYEILTDAIAKAEGRQP